MFANTHYFDIQTSKHTLQTANHAKSKPQDPHKKSYKRSKHTKTKRDFIQMESITNRIKTN